jgi:broad specificity phosphatase PhoE
MLIVVRHGQTANNARGLLLGRLDPSLDDVGRAQASAVAAALATRGENARIVASPLRRTCETAAIISRDEPFDIDERWIELDYGALDGTPVLDVSADTWAKWRSDPDFAPEDGETLASLGRRVRVACADLLTEAAERDVVVVTHVSPVKAAVVWALGVGDDVTWRTFVAPGSITRIGIRPHGPVLISFNETPWSITAGAGQSDG